MLRPRPGLQYGSQAPRRTSMMQMTGADLIVKLLERQGISTIAGVPGGAALPMYDALSKSETIHHVLCRHEQGAGFIAQGMARVSGRPEVCLASSGPGAGCCDAKTACV